MKKGLLLFLVLLLSVPEIAEAHRLNEYLQATTIRLHTGYIQMETRLTPGTDVAPMVLNGIDLNKNHLFSPAEQRAYALNFLRDISLMVDGHKTAIMLVSAAFPTAETIRNGVGDIVITYTAALKPDTSEHSLTLTNRHYPSIAVYLVNCLLPADSGIHIIRQTRNANQSVYQLDFATGVTGSVVPSDKQQLEKSDHVSVLRSYFVQGIHHILSGYDHLLFLCALVLGAAGLWDLIKVITVFTVAHSLTLTLAVFGWAHLPETVVEPIIAASIIIIAAQNMARTKYGRGNSRLAIAFFFGLFHGLGFAGGLLEMMHAMPVNTVVYALLGFSLGVEAGNQLVLLPLWGCLQVLGRKSRKKEPLSPLLPAH